ncbi:unnamed protein product [Adineta steineri]|uniref:Uncharacterized protein n=1 Tax=Adineta steineri TaxID=433720 RepID=A0A818SSU2_9BILA|nr:unnamed protein product [Adineta steineri]
MQHELGTENVVMMNNSDVPTTKPLELVKDPQLQRSRKILLIMIGIYFGICLVGTFAKIVNDAGNSQKNASVVGSIASIAYYGFGLLVSYKYSEIGLRVFAWLGVVILVITGIALILLFLAAVAGLAVAGVAFSALDSIKNNSTVVPSVDKAAIKGTMFGFSALIFISFILNLSYFILAVNNYCQVRFQVGQTH